MPAALENVVKQLEDSGIIAPGRLGPFVLPKAYPKDGEELVRELVKHAVLTKFQAQHVLAGKARALFLGNYTVLDRLGAGGMGQVFKAQHRRMERTVAIKMLPPAMTKDSAALSRFQREVKAAARLEHSNIVTAHDADEANGAHFLVMQYVDGADLSAVVKKNGPLPTATAINYILQAARGLEYAHGEGVVHRDIKPSNLLLDKKGTVKILDMGLARVSDPLAEAGSAPANDLTHTGSIMGTIDYMAPEQAMDSHQADARSDIYSLGCTLHYLLAGKPPYGGDTVLKRLTAHQQAAIPLLSSLRPDIPPGLNEVFARMMSKRPTARYQTAHELVSALESLGLQPAASKSPATASTAAHPKTEPPRVAAVNAKPAGSKHEFAVTPDDSDPNRAAGRGPSKLPLVGGAAALVLIALVAGWMVMGLDLNESTNELASATSSNGTLESLAADSKAAESKADALDSKAKPDAEPASSKPAATPQDNVAAVPSTNSAKIEPSPTPVSATASGVPVEPAPAASVTGMPAAAPLVVPPTAATALQSTKPAEEKKPPQIAAAPAAPPQTASAPAAGASKSDALLPIPTAEAQQKAGDLLKEVYKDDLAAAKKADAKLALAQKLLDESHQHAQNAPTALYVMWREANNLAIEAADPGLAEQAIGLIAERFEVDRLKELAAALSEMAARSHPVEVNHAIAEAALARIPEAQNAEDFDTAKRLADVAATAGRKAKDTTLAKKAIEQGKAVTAARQQFDAWQTAKETLAKTPGDPAANFTAGRYLCLVRNDWKTGLAHLSKGPDGPLKDLAAKQPQPADSAEKAAELGDLWFAAAEKAKTKESAEFRAGAAYWYSSAAPGLTGLLKSKVEKRLAELGGKVAVPTAESTGKFPESLELAVAPGLTIKLRLVPAGTFQMGSPPSEPGRLADEISHEVVIARPFYMGANEVSQELWQAVMGTNPSKFTGDPKHPVERVKWADCQEFIDRLNNSPLGRQYRFRMPSEAEWEYACRAGSTTAYFFGIDVAQLAKYAWFKDGANDTTHPCGQLLPNAWGLHDMFGNVSEWCSDWYAEKYALPPQNVDPLGPATGIDRLVRGGSFTSVAGNCRSARRDRRGPNNATEYIGLRLVCEPPGGSTPLVVANSPATRAAQKPSSAPAPRTPADASNQAVKRTPGTIDLLSNIDLQRNVFSGNDWHFEGRKLVTPTSYDGGAAARLVLPAAPAAEYTFYATVTPRIGSSLFIALAFGGSQCGVYLEKTNTTLGMIDGAKTSPAARQVWDGAKPIDITCEVSRGGITIFANDKEVLAWKGNPSQASLYPTWKVEGANGLIVGVANNGGTMEISRLEIGPLRGSKPRPSSK